MYLPQNIQSFKNPSMVPIFQGKGVAFNYFAEAENKSLANNSLTCKMHLFLDCRSYLEGQL